MTFPRGPYIAVRWPESHVLFQMLPSEDEAVSEGRRRQVLDSIREALTEMGIEVIEVTEEPIR